MKCFVRIGIIYWEAVYGIFRFSKILDFLWDFADV